MGIHSFHSNNLDSQHKKIQNAARTFPHKRHLQASPVPDPVPGYLDDVQKSRRFLLDHRGSRPVQGPERLGNTQRLREAFHQARSSLLCRQ